MNSNWPIAFLEFFVVLAFGIGWLILEWQGRRLDRKREEEKRAGTNSSDSTGYPPAGPSSSDV